MALPKQFGSYINQMRALDSAMANPRGCKVLLGSHGRAVRFRQMCYQVRKMWAESKGVPTPWDEVTISIEDQSDGSATVWLGNIMFEPVDIIPLDGIVPEKSSYEELQDWSDEIERQAKEMLASSGPTQFVPEHNHRAAPTPQPRKLTYNDVGQERLAASRKAMGKDEDGAGTQDEEATADAAALADPEQAPVNMDKLIPGAKLF